MYFKIYLFALVIFQLFGAATAQNRVIQTIPSNLVEDGKPISLEIVIFKPSGEGPFPTLVFNHGSVSNGNDPKEVGYTVTYPELASFYNEKGWMVVIPQRRGRGKSQGRYAEGWEATRGRYSCDPAVVATSIEHALLDLDAVDKYLMTRTDVDAKRMLVGGHSKGGILAMAFAARHPDRYQGVVNFVGGWVGERCETASEVNSGTFVKTSTFQKPTLWLYGENDPYYSLAHSKKNFEAFVAAGGKGSFEVFTLGIFRNDHQIVRTRSLWQTSMADFLKSLQN